MGAESNSSLSLSRCAERSLLSPCPGGANAFRQWHCYKLRWFLWSCGAFGGFRPRGGFAGHWFAGDDLFLTLGPGRRAFLGLGRGRRLLRLHGLRLGMPRRLLLRLSACARRLLLLFSFCHPSSIPVSRTGTTRIVEARCRSRAPVVLRNPHWLRHISRVWPASDPYKPNDSH